MIQYDNSQLYAVGSSEIKISRLRREFDNDQDTADKRDSIID